MIMVIGAALIALRFTSLYEPSHNVLRECFQVITFLFASLGILVILGAYSVGPF